MSLASRHNANLNILQDLYVASSTPSMQQKKRLSATLQDLLKNDRAVERTIAVAIFCIGVIALGFGMISFRGRLVNLTPAVQKTAEISLPKAEAATDLAGLSRRDTDGDGLSDYDEINVYLTSPYLDDSDSDRVTDKDEIAKQTDPNCAFESGCVARESAVAAVTVNSPLDQNLALLQGKASAEEVRQLLITSGVPKPEVDALTDEQIAVVYQEILNEARKGASALGSGTSVTNAVGQGQITDLNSITVEQARQLLISQGMDEATVNAISDADLIQLMQETLQEQGTTVQ